MKNERTLNFKIAAGAALLCLIVAMAYWSAKRRMLPAPTVVEAFLEPSGMPQNSRVLVRFGDLKEKLVRLPVPGQVIELRDDGAGGDTISGDGLYEGLVKLSFGDFRNRNQRLSLEPSHFASVLKKDTAVRVSITPFALASDVDWEKSLLYRFSDSDEDSFLAPDPCKHPGETGAFSFASLASRLQPDDTAGFVTNWLGQWDKKMMIGPDVIPKRDIGVILSRWPRTPDQKLDVSQSPLRLLALSYRPDLASPSDAGDAGQVRLIYEGLNCNPNTTSDVLDFTVIVEYGVKARTTGTTEEAQSRQMQEVREWARTWFDLKSATNYFSTLRDLGLFVTTPGDNSSYPVTVRFGQIRTNEGAFDFSSRIWELREFTLHNGQIEQTTVKRTPRRDLNKTQILTDFITQNAARIAANDFDSQLTTFLGGAAYIDEQAPQQYWKGKNVPPDLQETLTKFSDETCNGCHAKADNQTFSHVRSRAFGQRSTLSSFLMQDIQVRRRKLAGLVNNPFQKWFPDVPPVH